MLAAEFYLCFLKGRDELLGQWRRGPSFPASSIAAKDGVHVLAYGAKSHRLSEARREAWLAILREAKLK